MKCIISIFGIIVVVAGSTLMAQQPQDESPETALDSKVEVYQKENISNKMPIPLSRVREVDVMQEWTLWREIDLRQKENYPLYFPIAPKKIGSRVNFFTLLMEGIERGEITPYDPFPESDEFAQEITWEDIRKNPTIQFADKTENQVSPFTGNDTSVFIKGKNLLDDENIQRIIVKEKWFFDKRRSVFECRVMGIMPVFMYLKEGSEQPTPVPVCWIYMDEARPLLARHPVYNNFNEAQNISYDDFFVQTRYKARIIRVGNVFNNRYITDYASGLDALYESQRIEDMLFDWEQDRWEY